MSTPTELFIAAELPKRPYTDTFPFAAGKTLITTGVGLEVVAGDAPGEYLDNAFRIKDNNDTTKKIAFQASGIATGEERTITMPDADVDLGKVPTGVTPTYATGRLMVPLADGTSIPLSAFGGTRLPNLNSPATVLAANGHYLFYSNTGSYYTVICALVLPTAPDDTTYVRISNISSLNSFAANAGATVAPGGSDKINGVAATFSITDYLVNYRNAVITFTYSAFSENWTVSVLGDLIRPSTIAIYDADKTNSTTLTPVADLTTNRVITLPDADVNLGKVAQAATTSVDGYLTSTDWNTFNSKQAALDNVITAGTYGSSTQYAIPTFNEKGICTSVTLQTVTAGDTVLYPASGSNTVLTANTNYTVFVAADCALDCALLTGYVRLVNLVASTVNVLFSFPVGTNQYNEGGTNANTVALAGFGTAISTRNSASPTARRVARPQNALLGDIRWYPAMGFPAYYNWTGILTDTRNLILPDKDINFGDLPSVATSYTTGGMAGTRPQCVGGSLNVFTGGTDNVAVGSTSCTLHGTSNTIVNSQTTSLTTSSSNCVVLGGNGITLDASTRVAAINSRFCYVYGTDNAVINTSYGNIGASATNCSIVGGYGVSGTIQYIGNTDVTNVNFFGTVSCTTNNNCEDVALLNCRKFIVTSGQKRLTALNVTKFSNGADIPFPDTTLLVGTNGYLKSLVKLYAVTAADTVAVEALADNATFPTTNKRVKSYIPNDTDLQGIGRVLHKVSIAIRDNATGNDVTFATRYVATNGNSVILAPTANGTTDINIGSGVAFTLTATASGGAVYLSIASTGSIASKAILVVESEYF